jgi:hypothetical protein
VGRSQREGELPNRITLDNRERNALVKHGKKLGGKIKDVMTIVSYSTFRLPPVREAPTSLPLKFLKQHVVATPNLAGICSRTGRCPVREELHAKRNSDAYVPVSQLGDGSQATSGPRVWLGDE